MILYRLINNRYDKDIKVGSRIKRWQSPNNHCKNGDGMYFVADRKSAMKFRDSKSGHTYTHILKCEVPYNESDFADLIKNPSLIKPVSKKRYESYCKENNLKGVKWQQVKAEWIEYVILKDFIGEGFDVVEVIPA